MQWLKKIGSSLATALGFTVVAAISVAFFAWWEGRTKPRAATVEQGGAANANALENAGVVASENSKVAATGEVAAAAENAPAAPSTTMPAPLLTLCEKAPMLNVSIRFGWRLIERWNFDKCPLMAASMAYFGLLSLFPTLLAALAILGKVMSDQPEMRDKLLAFVQDFLPGEAGKILAGGELQHIAAGTSTTVGVLSIALLLWSGRSFFATLSSVLNSIWWQATPRTFLQNQLVMWGTLLGAGALWLLSTGVTFALTVVRGLVHQIPGFGDGTMISHLGLWSIVGRLFSWLLTVLMFWMIYRFLPNAKSGHRGRVAFGAALVAAVGWEAAKILFTSSLGGATKYGAIYGSVAGVIALLAWLYLSSTILLLGAEVAAVYEETKAEARGEAKPTRPRPDAARAATAGKVAH